ncbi:hypothetical protein N8303_00445 [Gammaproteobacteria bacterium]|nr:hypothetical protein [Gammaproteobacteria bacterium]
MKFFSYTLSLFILLVLSLPLLGLFIALEETSTYPLNRQLSLEQISSIEDMLIEYDPRYLFNNSDQFIELNEAESNALLIYFSQQLNNYNFDWLTDNTLSIELMPGSAKLGGSFAIKPNLFGRYLNVETSFEQVRNNLILQDLRLGDLKIPSFILRPFLNYSQQVLADNDNYRLLNLMLASIRQFEIKENYLGLTINWTTENFDLVREQARRLLIDETTHNQLITFQNHLTAILNEVPEDIRSISLNALIAPLFSLAMETEGDPVEENQAILLILSSFLLAELEIEDLVGTEAAAATISRPLRVTLEARDDLPRHMIASAAIAAYADNDMANMLSIYKEVHDSRSNSGFSFSDITANQIGTRIGELATEDQNTALQLQRFFAEVALESEYIPLVGRADGISEAEFIAQYGSRSSDTYLNRLEMIEDSIEQLPIFQSL